MLNWLINYKAMKRKTYSRRLAGQRTNSGTDQMGWVQNNNITSLVLSCDHLFPRDGCIMRWGKVRSWWREVLLNGLLDGVIAWEVAELSLWSGELEYDEKKTERVCTYVRGLVHIQAPSMSSPSVAL